MGRPRRRLAGEGGFALGTVIIGVFTIVILTVLVSRLALNQTSKADFGKREDTVLAGTEAMLERYAAKMTIDPSYYMSYVDEAEAPRVCSDSTSSGYLNVVQPGNPWIESCETWDYQETTDYYHHPLLEAGTGATSDDIGVLLHVTPPAQAGALEVTVVGRQGGRPSTRAVTVEIRAESLSEFAWLLEKDLRFGDGANSIGKVYSGGNIGYLPGAKAYGNVYAEGLIGYRDDYTWYWYYPPTWMDGAEGWDSTGNHNAAGEYITDVYPDPIDFDRFWDDLDLLEHAACEGGGICLDPAENHSIPSGANAYLIQTVQVGGETRLRVSYSTTAPSGSGCLTSEERWWVNSQNANWHYLDTFALPPNGALWANEHVVLGQNSSDTFELAGQLTIYAGNSSARRNVIIASDIRYHDDLDGGDVLGLVASDEIRVNPNAVGSDRDLFVYAAMLAQNGSVATARSCGDDGSPLTPSHSEFASFGSFASVETGDMAQSFETRNYDFDVRLDRIRPPFFPLLREEWTYTNWREITNPCWATTAGCS